MPDDRYKTTLEIGVDDREVRELGSAIQRALEVEPIMRFRRAIEEATSQIARLNAESQKGAGVPGTPGGTGGAGVPPAVPAVPAAPGGGKDRTAELRLELEVAKERNKKYNMGFGRMAAATGVGFMGAQAVQRGLGVAPALLRGQGGVASALGGLPVIGPFLQAMIGAVSQYGGQYGQYAQGLAPMGGLAGIGGLGGRVAAVGDEEKDKYRGFKGGGIRRAQKLGIAMPQYSQMVGQLAQPMGMRGEGVLDVVPRLLELERYAGIQSMQTAGLIGAAGVAGGGKEPSPREALATVTETLATGFEAGIRKQKLGQYLSEVASHTEQLRRQGILVDPQSIGTLVAGISKYGAGFKGAAGMQAITGMLGVMKGAGERTDFGAMLMMDVAMRQGKTPYQAMMMLEDPTKAREILPEIIARVGKMGGTVEARAMGLSQVFQGKLSKTQAYQLAQAVETGQMGGGSWQQVDSGKINDWFDEQALITAKSRGVAAKEASLTNQGIGVGAGAYDAHTRLRKQDLEMARWGVKFGSAAIKKILDKFKEYKDTLMDDGIGAMLKKIFGDTFDVLAKAVGKAVKEATKELIPGGMTPAEMGDEVGKIMNDPHEAAAAMKALTEILQKVYDFLIADEKEGFWAQVYKASGTPLALEAIAGVAAQVKAMQD